MWVIFIIVISLSLSYSIFFRDKVAIKKENIDKTVSSRPIYIPTNHTKESLVKREVVLMGTQFIFVIDAQKNIALNAITEVTKKLAMLESKLSSWKPGSDVYLLNLHAGKFVSVSQDTINILRISKQVYNETEGDFDITVGAVWDLYPFRDASTAMPTEQQLQQQLQFVGANKIQIDEDLLKAKIPKGMKINLGGIGKGYAANAAITIIKKMGIKNAAVSAGGDTYLMGTKATGPWNISIENPRWQGQIIEQFSITDYSVATSGDSKQFLKQNGKRYSHIINPKNGKLTSSTQSATIITKDATIADAYATAVFVKGAVAGMKWVNNKKDVEALIINSQGTIFHSAGWKKLTQQDYK